MVADNQGTPAAGANQTLRLPLMDVLECPPTIDPTQVRPPTDGGASGLTDAIDQSCPGASPPKQSGVR